MKRENDAAIRTSWTEGADPHTDDTESLKEHLIEVHRRNPGFTESCAGRCTDAEGKTSYDWLCDVAVDGKAQRVLDLACGSGFLLNLLAKRIPAAEALVGVDMSAAELSLARKRLDGANVTLHQGVAQNLAFAEAASFDTVLCHWALTLMDPVEPVFQEIGRVLTNGGTFAAIVDGDAAEAPGYDAVNDLVFAHVRAEVPSIGARDLGDPRIRKPETLSALARALFPDARISTQNRVFTLRGEAHMLAEEAVGFFYAAFVLSPLARAALTDQLADLLTAQADGNVPTFSLPVCRLLVRVPST
ncbi:MAG: class I SAM-dependent methyltransferase [Pseudomonadota bacterium]